MVVSRQSGARLVTKRFLDVTIAVLALVLLSPILAGIAVAIRLDSSGPALFKQTRIGRGGSKFEILKFRTMVDAADESLHAEFVKALMRQESAADTVHKTFKLNGDPRLTRVGRFLRTTSLDEIPQLVNVLRGEMSLVGPRPDVPYAVEEYEPRHWRRFDVLPGITGLWQVSGRSELSPIEMLELDLRYVESYSLLLDCKILARTIPTVLRQIGSG